MLTSDQLDRLTEPVVQLYLEFEESVIRDIARRLAGLDMTATAAFQAQRLGEAGALYEHIIELLAGLTGRTEAQLRDAFRAAGVRSIRFDDKVYRAAGLDPLPLNLSPQMAQLLLTGFQRTAGLMRNITLTTALSGQQTFIQAADLAWAQVSTGAFSYDQAIRAAVESVGERGMFVFFPSGRIDKLDVAMRRAVLTGVAQTTGEMQLGRLDEMGVDLVQTSAHIGARPSHQIWQGQVFSRSGTHTKYPPFVESTGYGSVTGLLGINCRHTFFPFFEGLSENAYRGAEVDDYSNQTVSLGGEEIPIYEATQKQRAIERKIREWKRRAAALDGAGLENAAQLSKVREWQVQMREFLRETGLDRQYVRERVN